MEKSDHLTLRDIDVCDLLCCCLLICGVLVFSAYSSFLDRVLRD